METFPAAAKLLFNGFAQQRSSAIERTQMESGPPKQLKFQSRVLLQRQVAYAFDTQADYDAFITWFTTNINRGADWFTWTDPETSAAVTARIVSGTLKQEAPVRRAFDMWQVSFSIETWDA